MDDLATTFNSRMKLLYRLDTPEKKRLMERIKLSNVIEKL